MNLRVLSVYVWTVALLAGVELVLEYRGYRRGWQTPIFGRRPYATASAGDATPPRYGPTAQFPFRSQIVPCVRTDEVLRLWVASASHAEDTYVSVEQTFPEQTGRKLSAAGPHRWQVLNASRSGKSIAKNTADLSTLAPDWQPDVVVLYQMSMDIVELSRTYLSGNQSAQEAETEDSQPEPVAPGAVAKMAADTAMYEAIKANVTPWFTAQRVLADRLEDDATGEFEARVREFVVAVRNLGATPVLCTFAASESLDDPDGLSTSVRQFMLSYNRYLSPRGWTLAIARFNELIRRIAAEEGVALVDCDRAMTGQSGYFRDFVHFTPAGHERVAELLAQRLQVLQPLVAASSAGQGAAE